MKTYLLNLTNEIRNWSNTLDVKSILCSKSWLVFNEEGKKEVFIFETDGSLIISVDGKVTNACWKYIPVNSSLIITTDNKESFMLNPFSYDDKVLTLQLDGTNEYSVLIDEQEVEKLSLTSLALINLYINHYTQYKKKQIEEKEIKESAEYEKRQAKIKAREKWDKEINSMLEDWKKSPEYKKMSRGKIRVGILVVILGIILIFSPKILVDLGVIDTTEHLIGWVPFIGFAICISSIFIIASRSNKIREKLKQLVKEHPFIHKEE